MTTMWSTRRREVRTAWMRTKRVQGVRGGEEGQAQEAAPRDLGVDPYRHEVSVGDRGWNSPEREPEIVLEDLPEHRVLDHGPVVVGADLHRRATRLGGGEEAVVERRRRR